MYIRLRDGNGDSALVLARQGGICWRGLFPYAARSTAQTEKQKRIVLSVDAFRFVMFFHIAKRVSGGNPLAIRERVSPFIVFCFSIRVLVPSHRRIVVRGARRVAHPTLLAWGDTTS